MPDWIRDNGALLGWLTVLSVVTLALSALLLPLIIARIPEEYFLHPEPTPGSFRGRHPVVRIGARVLKNLLGVVFLAAGFAMLFVPGQGLLTMFIGLLLVEGPGKRRFELWLVRRGAVLRALNWVRRRAGRPPLRVDGGPRADQGARITPMTSQLSALASRFRFNEGLLGAATKGFTDATWAHSPDGGGNTAHWVLGHVTHARRGMLRMAGADLPLEPWEEAFGKDATPGATDDYPPVDELMASFRAAGETIATHFEAMSDDAAQAPSPHPFPDGSKTLGDAMHFLYFHETYHLGQIGYIRRVEGLPGFI